MVLCLGGPDRASLAGYIEEAYSVTQVGEVLDDFFTGCEDANGAAAPTTEKKKKRRPSGYNLFIGSCMKEGAADMKSCAGNWKQLGDVQDDWREKAKVAA